jgi:putative sterol carrier protein
VAGFPEVSVFDQLSSWARFIFGRNNNLVAEIYRPAAEAMAQDFLKDKVQDVLEATRQAGREIVKSLRVSPETMARITQDLAQDKWMMAKMGNIFWKTCIAEGVTPKEFGEKGLIPRPDSIETFMWITSMGFNPQGAGDTKAVLQFNFTGTVEGTCHFIIDSGRIRGVEGPAETADLVLDTPFELWMDIFTGKTNGQQAFMDQKYKVNGDFNLLLRMHELFGK